MLTTRDSELEAIIDAYESRRVDAPSVSVDEFLPSPAHPRYVEVATELLRVDLEYAWQAGERDLLTHYVDRYPDLLTLPERLAPLGFEEYRLRCQAGERVDRSEYSSRWGIDVSGWPELKRQGGQPSASWLAHLARREQAEEPRAFPEAGEERAGFRFVAEIGRGSFSRVYLAQQDSLANRLVVLKISSQHWIESDYLARLQHTNIVPIYSVHRDGAHQFVCMPFLGCCTLADVLRKLFHSNPGVSVVPRSGAALMSTLADRAAETLTDSRVAQATRPVPTPVQFLSAPRSSLERLREYSYVDACLWIAAEVASGLAHAHHLGIIHRDLKPANLLITDDGRPMLLDFNLSADDADVDKSNNDVGGTLPYMAPEHLEALEGRARPDARSDIYSLGVLLFELLTGTRPFSDRQGNLNDVVKAMVSERTTLTYHQLRTRLSMANDFVSPAVMAIVFRCLAPDPRARYQMADELLEDLQRQLSHRPLRFAPEPSLRERFRKWSHRHPRIASAVGASVIATGLLAVVTSAWIARGVHVARLSAQNEWSAFHDEYQTARLALRQPEIQPSALQRGVRAAQEQLRRYLPSATANLVEHPGYQRLSAEQQVSLRNELSELAFLLSTAEARVARGAATDAARQQYLNDAIAWNARAAALSARPWPAVDWQAKQLQRQAAGETTLTKADALPLADTSDGWTLFSAGVLQFEHGQYQDAVATLTRATEQQPQDFAAWFALGNAHAAAAHWQEAESCYTTCHALRPQTWVALFHRSLVRFETHEFDAAEHDCDLALQLAPDEPVLLLNRAIARRQQGRLAEAERDLDRVLSMEPTITRAYFIRSAVREKLGNKKGAANDRHAGFEAEPTDVQSWLARGMARLPGDQEGAIADLRKALALDPHSVSTLRNLAYIYSEVTHELPLAIDLLTIAVTLRPNDADLLASRGVLLARNQQFAAARADGKVSLKLDDQAQTLIHVACIFALTAADDPADLEQAATLVERGLRKDSQWLTVVAHDSDLTALRNHDRYRQAVLAAENTNAPRGTAPTPEQ